MTLPSGEGLSPPQAEAGALKPVKLKDFMGQPFAPDATDAGLRGQLWAGISQGLANPKAIPGVEGSFRIYLNNPSSPILDNREKAFFDNLPDEKKAELRAFYLEAEEPAAEAPLVGQVDIRAQALAALDFAAGGQPARPEPAPARPDASPPPQAPTPEPAPPTPSNPRVAPESQPVPAIIDDIGKLIKLGPEAVAVGLNSRSDRLLDITQRRRIELGTELEATAAQRTEAADKQGQYELQASPAKVDLKRLAAFPQEAAALREANTGRDEVSRRVSRSKAVVELTTQYDQLLGEMETTQKQITSADTTLAAQRSKLTGNVDEFNVSQGDLFDIGANIAWRLRRLDTPNLPATERARLLTDAKGFAQRAHLEVDVPDDSLPAVLKTYVGFIRSNAGVGKQYASYESVFMGAQENKAKRLDLAGKKSKLETNIDTVISEAKKYAGVAGEAEVARIDQAMDEIDSQIALVEAVRKSISNVDDELPTITAIRGLQNPVVEANTGYLAILQEIGLRPEQVTEDVLKNWKYTNHEQERRTWKAVRSRRKAEETYFRAVSYPDLLLAKIGDPPPENLVPFVKALRDVLGKQAEPAGQTGVNKEALDLAKDIVGELPPVTTPVPVETHEQADAVQQIRQRLQAERTRTTPVDQDTNAVAEAGEIADITGFEAGDAIAFSTEMTHWAQLAENRGKLEAVLKEVSDLCQLPVNDIATRMAAVNPESAKNNPVYQMVKLLTDRKMTTKEMLNKLKEYKKRKGGNVGQYLTGFMLLFQILGPLIEKDESAATGAGGHSQQA